MNGEYYKMDYEAWDEGTANLSLEEEAAYLRLCHQMYRRGQPVPIYDRMLCLIWRCHQNKARPLLKRLIDKGKITLLEDGRVINGRVAKELDARETLRTHRVHAGYTGGIRSGEARRNALKTNDPIEAKRTIGEERRGEERKKDGADAPADLEKQFFDRAVEVINGPPNDARKIAGLLRKACGNDIAKARSSLELSVGKSHPKSWIMGHISWLKKKTAEPSDDTVLMTHADDRYVIQ